MILQVAQEAMAEKEGIAISTIFLSGSVAGTVEPMVKLQGERMAIPEAVEQVR